MPTVGDARAFKGIYLSGQVASSGEVWIFNGTQFVPGNPTPAPQAASSITVTTTAFSGILSAVDNTAQKAFDTIDDHTHSGLVPSAHASTHWSGGSDVISGDLVTVAYSPANYSAGAATLLGHLSGIDADLATFAALNHSGTHLWSGLDEIDGDKLGMSFSPSNYTRTVVAPYTTNAAELTSHLKGIDAALGSSVAAPGATSYVTWNNAGAFAADSGFNWVNATKILNSSGDVNTGSGFQVAGSGDSGKYLVGNGTRFAPAALTDDPDFSGASGVGQSGLDLASGTSGSHSGWISGTSGLLLTTSGELQSGVTETSGVAQSGLDLAKTVKETLTQAGHGFAAGDDIRRDSGTNSYVKAQADTEEHVESIGVVESVDGDNFVVVYEGRISGLTGLTDGGVYYTSAATAGLLTLTEPDYELYFSKPRLVADSASGGIVVNMRALSMSYGSGAVARADVVGGRLELVNSGQIKWAFYESDQIRLWNPGTSGWEIVQVASEPTLDYDFVDISGWDASGERAYDIFAEYVDGTSFTLVANPWSGTTTTSARYVSPARHDGVYCYDNMTDDGKSRRWLGSIYMETGPIFKEDSGYHFIDNLYHQRYLAIRGYGSGEEVVTATSYGELQGMTRAEAIFCTSKHVSLAASLNTSGASGGGPMYGANAVDSTSDYYGNTGLSPFQNAGAFSVHPSFAEVPIGAGYHYFTIVRKVDGGSGKYNAAATSTLARFEG